MAVREISLGFTVSVHRQWPLGLLCSSVCWNKLWLFQIQWKLTWIWGGSLPATEPQGNGWPVALNTSTSRLSLPPLLHSSTLYPGALTEGTYFRKRPLVMWWTCKPRLKWKPTHSILPGRTRNIPTEVMKEHGTSEKIATFIEGFLSKTQVNIGTTLSIRDMVLCTAITSIEYPPTTTGIDHFFFSYQLSLLYTLTTHAGSDNQEKKTR